MAVNCCRPLFLLSVALFLAESHAADSPVRPKHDANGNPIRYAATGHASNYDEAKVGRYTLPDPLVSRSGERVRDAATWESRRRPELLKLYEDEIFGRVPERAPRVVWFTLGQAPAFDGTAVRTSALATFTPVDGDAARAIKVPLSLYLPATARGPVPVVLHVSFYSDSAEPPSAAAAAKLPAWARPSEAGPVAEMLARGYGYAILRYTDLQPDNATSNQSGIRALALAPGQTQPGAGEWGAIAAWSWGASRALDFLETQPGVDAKRVALVGFSRLGKTALWAGARDPRFAVVFAACSGEMGASLARRDYGESVDDVLQNFPWWFAGAFSKYAARWAELPVDAHTVIALNAPRPVFLTAGTQDQWADPHGMFLAAVAAGPVYRLLGKKDLGTDKLPPLDTPLIAGDLGFLYHTGGHTITAGDWAAFLEFADRTLRPMP